MVDGALFETIVIYSSWCCCCCCCRWKVKRLHHLPLCSCFFLYNCTRVVMARALWSLPAEPVADIPLTESSHPDNGNGNDTSIGTEDEISTVSEHSHTIPTEDELASNADHSCSSEFTESQSKTEADDTYTDDFEAETLPGSLSVHSDDLCDDNEKITQSAYYSEDFETTSAISASGVTNQSEETNAYTDDFEPDSQRLAQITSSGTAYSDDFESPLPTPRSTCTTQTLESTDLSLLPAVDDGPCPAPRSRQAPARQSLMYQYLSGSGRSSEEMLSEGTSGGSLTDHSLRYDCIIMGFLRLLLLVIQRASKGGVAMTVV